VLRKLLPHGAIIISLMYLVFFCIDRVNTAMAFINNDITKVLLLVLCIISSINAGLIIADDRKRIRARRQREVQQRAAQQRAAQQRQAQQRTARYDYDRYERPRREYREVYREDYRREYRGRY